MKLTIYNKGMLIKSKGGFGGQRQRASGDNTNDSRSNSSDNLGSRVGEPIWEVI